MALELRHGWRLTHGLGGPSRRYRALGPGTRQLRPDLGRGRRRAVTTPYLEYAPAMARHRPLRRRPHHEHLGREQRHAARDAMDRRRGLGLGGPKWNRNISERAAKLRDRAG